MLLTCLNTYFDSCGVCVGANPMGSRRDCLHAWSLSIGAFGALGHDIMSNTSKNEFRKTHFDVHKQIQNNELWSPICFLLHECLPDNQRLEISKKIQNEADDPETVNEILNLIKEHDLTDMVKSAAEKELKLAKECLLNLEIDTRLLLPLTQFSVI